MVLARHEVTRGKDGVMKLRLLPVVLACSAPVLMVAASLPAAQVESERTARSRAHIDRVTQGFHSLAINLIVTGSGFPANSSTRKVRLVAEGTDGLARGELYFESGNRMWTSTRIETFLSFNVVAGRNYKVGIVQASATNPKEMRLISNEVEYLLLINLDNALPSPVPLGTGEVTVATANMLGPQGSKVVKFGNQPAAVVSWGTATGSLRVKIPANLARPGQHDVWIENDGRIVSNKLRVRLLGPTTE